MVEHLVANQIAGVRFSIPAQTKRSGKEARESVLRQMLSLIKKHPGIRPSELSRLLKREHSAGLRNALIRRRFVWKKKVGVAVHYYSKNY